MVPLLSGDSIYGAIVCCSNTRQYDSSDLEMLEEIGRRASLAVAHADGLVRERRLIQTIQEATLPAHLARVDGASLSAIYRPAASEVQVGGDSDAGHSVALVARSPPTPSSSRGPGCPGRERLTRGGCGLR